MVEGISLVGGLLKVMAGHDVVKPEVTEDGWHSVHVSFSRDELDQVLVKVWEDGEQRIHLAARWKPE